MLYTLFEKKRKKERTGLKKKEIEEKQVEK